MTKEQITFTGAAETMLATLYGRAVDSRAADPILGDNAADAAVQRIDYDFAKTKMDATSAAGVALRAKLLDDWTGEFLDQHAEPTVIHLACGLDTRAQRMAPPASVRWVDVDLPQVIKLRERLLPAPSGDYQLVEASVTDDDWLEQIPADRPTVVVFEGLSMYLRPEEGRRLIERITTRFSSGQLLFDCYGTLGIRLQKLVPAVRNAGAELHWGIDDPYELQRWHDSLKCLDAVRSVATPGLEKMPRAGRAKMWVLARIPGLRDIGQILRYRF